MSRYCDPRVDWHETLIGGKYIASAHTAVVDYENMYNGAVLNLGGMTAAEYMKNPVVEAIIASGGTKPSPSGETETTSSGATYIICYSGHGITEEKVIAGDFSLSQLRKVEDVILKKDTQFDIEISYEEGDLKTINKNKLEVYRYFAFIASDKELADITDTNGNSVTGETGSGKEWIVLDDKIDGKYVYYSLDDKDEQSIDKTEDIKTINFKVKL